MKNRQSSVPVLLSIALITLVTSQPIIISSASGLKGQSAPWKLPTILFINSTPNPSDSNQAITISGRLLSRGPSDLSGKDVRIDWSVEGSQFGILAWTKTKGDGSFALSLTPPQFPSLYVRAFFSGDSAYQGSFSNTILQRIVSFFNFRITTNPSFISIQQGQTSSVGCSIVLLRGTAQTVTLSLSGLPSGSGCTYSLNPSSGTPPFSSTLTINVCASTTTVIYLLTVTGRAGNGLTRTSFLILIVAKSVRSAYSLIVSTEPSGITAISGAGSYSAGSIANLGMAPETIEGIGIRYVFQYWKVDGKQVSGNPPTITMDKNHAAVAVYKTQYYLTVQSAQGTPTQPSGYEDANSKIIVSVPETVNSEYDLRYICKSYLLDGSSHSGNSACVTMDRPHNLTFVWTLQFYLILTCAITGPTLLGENWYNYGANATIQAPATFNASDGKQYQFHQWASTGAKTPQIANPYASTTTLVMNSSGYQLEAQYDIIAQDDPQLTIRVYPAGCGSTSPSPGSYSYVPGSTVAVSETPTTGYKFDHWDLDGSNVGSNPNYTVVVEVPHILTAIFSAANVSVPGTIYFKSDNEVDPFKEWRGEVYNSPGGGEIYGDRTSEGPSDADLRQVMNPVHSGTYAAEWYVGNLTAQTNYTSQVKGMYWRIDQQEAYYSTWYYFPNDFHGTIGGWCNIMQWKDDSPPYYPIGIVLAKEYGDGTWLTVQEWKGAWGARIMKLPEGRWFHLQIYYKLGYTDGVVKVWVDGQLVKEWSGIKTRGPGPNVMWGIGNFPDATHPPNQSIYTDDTYVTSEYINPAIWG